MTFQEGKTDEKNICGRIRFSVFVHLQWAPIKATSENVIDSQSSGYRRTYHNLLKKGVPFLKKYHYLIIFNHIYAENLAPLKKNHKIFCGQNLWIILDRCPIYTILLGFLWTKTLISFFYFNIYHMKNKIRLRKKYVDGLF